jgi:hypothetical protein
MANMSARQMFVERTVRTYDHYGGFAERAADRNDKDGGDGPLYQGPTWFTENMGDIY